MSGEGATNQKYLEMSDEDFLNTNPPASFETEGAAPAADPKPEEEEASNEGASSTPADEGNEAGEAEAAASEEDEKESTDDVNKGANKDAGEEGSDEGAGTDANTFADDAKKPDGASPSGSPDKGAEGAASDKTEDGADGEGADKGNEGGKGKQEPKDAQEQDQAETKPVDYEAFFKQVMAPFKANGRTIELKSPDEAIRLMQMGAGYGRKIQDLQPHLKVLRMLEKNELLDENKLSFLIDVNAKNPEAIKKIIKDAGIDPLDINTEDNVDYIPKNHAVSDQEMALHQALEDIQSQPTGQETLQLINQTWDKESKSLLWESPELLGVIQTQRDTGVYDQIAAEIDRQKLLGTIPNSMPFLQAYKVAGDHLVSAKALNGSSQGAGEQGTQIQNQPEATNQAPQPQVIATRTATPKAKVQNGDKAAAASVTKTSQTRKSSSFVNPLEMADDEFLKQFEGRL